MFIDSTENHSFQKYPNPPQYSRLLNKRAYPPRLIKSAILKFQIQKNDMQGKADNIFESLITSKKRRNFGTQK